MAYIGNDLQVAFSTYKNIDDISGSFNSVTTSFALLVNGSAPAPLPLNSNQCLISVGGVVQRPDDTGSEGFRLSGGNIIFSSAPNTGEDFFGVILAGADYVNAGANFPDGTLAAPSITFDQDNDTGYYRSGSGSVSFASNGVAAGTWSSAGLTAPALIPTGSSVPANGVYLPGVNRVGVSTNSSARLEVDASGRLLVGTSTAYAAVSGVTPFIQLQGTGENAYASIARWAANTTNGGLIFNKSRGASVGTRGVVAASDGLGEILFAGDDGTNFIGGARIEAIVDGTPGANDMPGRLVFSTTADGASSPTERMRIDRSGNLLVGIASTLIASAHSFEAGGAAVLALRNNGSSFGNYWQVGPDSNSTFKVYNQSNTGVFLSTGSTSWSSSSDERQKNIIEPIADAINKVSTLRSVIGSYKTDDKQQRRAFLIAQDVEKVLPEAVTTTPDGFLGVAYTDLIPLLVAALNESKERIESLEAKVAALEIA